jgi:hypothetical protein
MGKGPAVFSTPLAEVDDKRGTFKKSDGAGGDGGISVAVNHAGADTGKAFRGESVLQKFFRFDLVFGVKISDTAVKGELIFTFSMKVAESVNIGCGKVNKAFDSVFH